MTIHTRVTTHRVVVIYGEMYFTFYISPRRWDGHIVVKHRARSDIE